MKRAPRPDAVLVTGAAGFLGGALTRHLIAAERAVTGLDVVASDALDMASVIADVRDSDAVRSAVRRSGASMIVHAAAALPNCSDAHLHAVNVTGTRNVLEAARECGVERVVFVSSSSVFPVRGSHDEDAPRAALSSYAASKVEAERLCVEARERGLSVAVLRVVPVVGPGRLGIFGLLFEWVREGRRIPMIGDGSNHAYPVATPARAGSATKHGTFQTDGSVSCCGAADVTRTITRWAESSERRVNHKRAASRFQELSMRNVSCTPAGSWQTSGTLSTISKSPSQRSTAMIRMACWSMAT